MFQKPKKWELLENRRSLRTVPNNVTVNHGFDKASRRTGLTFKKGQNVPGNLDVWPRSAGASGHTNIWLHSPIRARHGVSFAQAQFAFADPKRVIAEDLSHGSGEKRYSCFGWVEGGVLTVRFTYRGEGHPNLRRWVLAKGQASL